MARKIRYDADGQEVVEQAEEGESLVPEEFADSSLYVRIRVGHHEDADEITHSPDWQVELLSERFAQLVTDLRGQYFHYCNVSSEVHEEHEALHTWALMMWKRLKEWGLLDEYEVE